MCGSPASGSCPDIQWRYWSKSLGFASMGEKQEQDVIGSAFNSHISQCDSKSLPHTHIHTGSLACVFNSVDTIVQASQPSAENESIFTH